ncbi:hypothetical protein [Acrocarpospora corrugata]|uniref:hypothetical protein n=1 Tax=Acrocarpospora corrugata TaxID=35763 RepID=UPI001FE2782D|nr:hypothetical protein [Acrocarpospora corrugata]
MHQHRPVILGESHIRFDAVGIRRQGAPERRQGVLRSRGGWLRSWLPARTPVTWYVQAGTELLAGLSAVRAAAWAGRPVARSQEPADGGARG